MDVLDEFIRAVPDAVRPTIQELLRQPRVSVEGLREQVRRHTRTYAAVASSGEPLDPELALKIEERCLDLLDRVGDDTPDAERSMIQAACEYYVFDDDADGDFDSVAGLDDDAEVVNAALFVLGLDTQSIQIP